MPDELPSISITPTIVRLARESRSLRRQCDQTRCDSDEWPDIYRRTKVAEFTLSYEVQSALEYAGLLED